ncbi:hypothetical protein CPB86DRAFT_777526 [Serendipita vermifera]|nr:hypothetical protein CPB86DRAFT_777526 [Serendipita vermifera]
MTKPNVIIFGGVQVYTPTLALQLIPPLPAEPLVSHLRIIDKYSIHPPTTFIPKAFQKLLEERKDVIDYQQRNLTNPAVVKECFDSPAPDGQPFTIIYDWTGNNIYSLSAEVQIAQTLKVSLPIANEAAKRQVKAYIRFLPSYYQVTDPTAKYVEQDPEGWKPMGTRGVWWHETIRAIGSIPNLPLVVLRLGIIYGPNVVRKEVTSAILLGSIYKRLGEEIKVQWSPTLRKNTLHMQDAAQMAWKAAEWMSTIDRATANSLIGVPVPTSNDEKVKDVPEARQASQGDVLVPVFYLVDGSDTTQGFMSQRIANFFGIKVIFDGDTTAKATATDLQELTETLNEKHVTAWTEMIATSNPSVVGTPLTPYVEAYEVDEHGCALNGEKFRKLLSYQPKYPRFDEQGIEEYIQWCREEGIWPE